MKNILIVLLAFTICSCGTNSTTSESVDSTAADAGIDTLNNVYADDSVNYSLPMGDLKDADTLFNLFARMKLITGEFESVEVITNSFIDTDDLKRDGLMAVLVVTGEGEYNGIRENIQFATQHATLGILQWNEKEQLDLVGSAYLGSTESMGLYAYSVEAEAFMLTQDRFAVMIHNKSSEDGAGDAAFRKDEVEMYVLLKGDVVPVFKTTVDDFQFASDEQGSWAEATTTVQITVVDEKSNGLFDIRTQSSTVENGSGPEEGEPTEEPQETSGAQEASVDDGISIFKWNGEEYVLSPTND